MLTSNGSTAPPRTLVSLVADVVGQYFWIGIVSKVGVRINAAASVGTINVTEILSQDVEESVVVHLSLHGEEFGVCLVLLVREEEKESIIKQNRVSGMRKTFLPPLFYHILCLRTLKIVRQQAAESGMFRVHLHGCTILDPATNVGRHPVTVVDHGKEAHNEGRLGRHGDARTDNLEGTEFAVVVIVVASAAAHQ